MAGNSFVVQESPFATLPSFELPEGIPRNALRTEHLSDPNPIENHPHYRKVERLGSGSFSFVDLVEDNKTGERIAVKYIPRGQNINKYVQREILNHRKLKHLHVVAFKGVFLTRDYLGIALEYLPKRDLLTWVSLYCRNGESLDERVVRWFFQQLIVALKYVHRQGVSSRDIKLENTLLGDGEWPVLKLGDFGFSKHERSLPPKSLVGTQPYLAPEVIDKCLKGEEYDAQKADIWAAGVFLHVLKFGAYPFDLGSAAKDDTADVQRRIGTTAYQIPPGLDCSPECEDLLRKILVRDPADRPSTLEIQEHAWYQRELPPGLGALDYGMEDSEDSQKVQSEEDILKLIEEAQRVPDGSSGSYNSFGFGF